MKSLRELLLLMRLAQSKASVLYHLRDIERAKAGLAKAYAAFDQAVADLVVHEAPQRDSDPPRFLLGGKTKRRGSGR